MQARSRRVWLRTTLTLAALSTVIAVAARYADRERIDMPARPAPPRAPADGQMLDRRGDPMSPVQPSGTLPFVAAFERGLAAYNADDPDAAADAFEEAVRLSPADPEARINLGLVYLRLRRADDGLRELREGARLQRRQGAPPANVLPDATIRARERPSDNAAAAPGP